jgi:hypothetical protein
MSSLGDFLSVIEASREGPKPLIRITRFTFILKKIRMQRSIGEEDSMKQVVGSWHLTRRAPSPSGATVIKLFHSITS